MTRFGRLLACVFVVLAAMTTSGCTEGGGGIGMGVPSSGARWGGGTTNPGVIVGGGPVYR
jgi:predicted small secreted protein